MDSNPPSLPQTAKDGLSVLSSLINGAPHHQQDFEAAYAYAQQLKDAFPNNPHVWSQLVLVCNLTDRNSEAVGVQKQAGQQCAAWSNLHEGDCERDHALFCIRNGLLWKAQQHIARAVELHAGNLNRRAATRMVYGRIFYAQKRYEYSARELAKALMTWDAIAKQVNDGELGQDCRPDPQWQFNCLRWLLKATIAHHGRGKKSKDVFDELQVWSHAYGSPEVLARIRLVARGKFFNRLDDLIESPFGHKLLRRLGFEALARMLLK